MQDFIRNVSIPETTLACGGHFREQYVPPPVHHSQPHTLIHLEDQELNLIKKSSFDTFLSFFHIVADWHRNPEALTAWTVVQALMDIDVTV